MAMWQPTRCAKINLKTLIEIAHAAQQILFKSMSIVKTVIMVNFKTLKPFHSSSSARLFLVGEVYKSSFLSKNGAKRRNNHRDCFCSSFVRSKRMCIDQGWSEMKEKPATSF